uniref:Retrovirus-related Pol polyprotein from transposon TNT 1-94 n=1 Tax=Cajanus cajan TaxID=3821 RepID=A0A151UDC7_CAJCA
MTEGVATQLLHSETSKELWEGAQILNFHSFRKGSMKMEEYLIKMKSLADSLKLAGSLISNTDLITQTLAGLDFDYNAIVVQLSDKNDLTWIDM